MRILFDYGLAPVLLNDFGHYLYDDKVRDAVAIEWDDKGWRKRLFKKRGTDMTDVLIVDARMRVGCIIDYMRWEDGKFRLYIRGDRVARVCPRMREQMEDLAGRTALATARKVLGSLVHTDFVQVGMRRVRYNPSVRRGDVRSIHRVHAILDGASFLRPSTFLPNVKAEYGDRLRLDPNGEKTKTAAATWSRDVSVMWQCGNSRRDHCHRSGVYSWDDARFLPVFSQVVPRTYSDIARKMIRLARSDKRYDFPPDAPARFPEIFRPRDTSNWMFVDFETDYSHCIYMFGSFMEDGGYSCEWGDGIDDRSEKALMERIYRIVRAHRERGGVVVYYYAEDRFWRERCIHHDLPHEYETLFRNTVDLQYVFQSAPLLVKDVFNFKLKHLAAALFRNGDVPIQQPEGCSDGAESIVLAQRYFRENCPETIRRVLEAYNRFDCEILREMVIFLRHYYSHGDVNRR